MQEQDIADRIAEMIDRGEIAGEGKSATVGFDGFVDTVVRIVRDRDPGGQPIHFAAKSDFGQHLIARAAHNSSFELTDVVTKIGGNMPITAHALGRLGVRVNCIGMLGRPTPHPLFGGMDDNCTLHSFADPTHSTALEFDDGKVLLANGASLRGISWPTVHETFGTEALAELYHDADAVGFANWGEIDHATEIWEGIEREVLQGVPGGKHRVALFDLADSSRRSAADAARLAALIGRMSAIHETILCLNLSEVFCLADLLGCRARGGAAEAAGGAVFGALDVHTLIVRHPRTAIAWTKEGVTTAGTFYVERPLLSTGGGDNFNAGYCFARLVGLNTRLALVVASAVAGFYVTTGDSPTLPQLSRFLREAFGRREQAS